MSLFTLSPSAWVPEGMAFIMDDQVRQELDELYFLCSKDFQFKSRDGHLVVTVNYEPFVKRLKELIAEGKLGVIKNIGE